MWQNLEQLKGKCWWNGEVVNLQESKISLFTHSLHYSGAVFEGIRVYNHVAFKLEEHMIRLHESAKALSYHVPYNVEELKSAVIQLIKIQDLKSGYVRPFVWRGAEEQTMSGAKCSIQTAILCWDAFDLAEENAAQKKGISLEIARWKKPSADMVPYHSKASGLYMMATLIKNEAAARGFSDALVLDAAGYITEAATSNFFYIKDDALYTPIADSFLNGITRQTVIALALDIGIKVYEERVTVEDLRCADAAFLTGTAMGIMPIRGIQDIELDTHNKVMWSLIDTYNSLVNALQFRLK